MLGILPQSRAYPGSEFVVANTLAKCKKLEPMKLTLAKVLARNKYEEVVLYLTLFPTSGEFCHMLIPFANSLDPVCKQFGPRSGPTYCRAYLDPNCLTL